MGRIFGLILLSSFVQTFAAAAPPRYRMAPERVELFSGGESVEHSYGGRKAYWNGTYPNLKSSFEWAGQRRQVSDFVGSEKFVTNLDNRFTLLSLDPPATSFRYGNEYLDGLELKKLDDVILPNGALEPRSLYKAQNGWVMGQTGSRGFDPRALAYHPDSGQMIEQRVGGQYAAFIGATPDGTLLVQASNEDGAQYGSSKFNSGTWLYQNGQYQLINDEAWAHGINDAGEVLFVAQEAFLMRRNADGSRYWYDMGWFHMDVEPSGFAENGHFVGDGFYRENNPWGFESNGAFYADRERIYSLHELVENYSPRDHFIAPWMDPITGKIYVTAIDNDTRKRYQVRLDPVPEPGTLAALGLGLAAVARRRWTKAN